ncbi:V-type ATPase subunit [Candidatus Woesearchaeota archaeon]|nr:V-type ATPase subunit [Candidatus Woesearchaeota archaeon]
MANATLINATKSLTNATGLNESLLDAVATSKLAFLQTFANPVVLVFGLSVLLVVVILLFVIRNVTPVSKFLYANARIQARSNFMVSEQLLTELTEAKSLKEFRSLLRDTEFGEELEKSSEGLRSFHSALEKGFINSIIELIELSPDKSKPLLNAYLMFLEAEMLKIIYRARLMKAEIDESLVYPIGNINEERLRHLLGTESIADIGVVMAPTAYSEVFGKKYEKLEEFEVALDQFVFNNFVDVIQKTKMHDGRYIIDILNKKIDIFNILALLKFRIRNIEKEKQKNLLIDNKTDLCLRFDELIKAGTLKESVEALKGLPYHEPLTKALEKHEKDGSLSHFENELYRFFKEFVASNDLGHTLGPYPLISYLIKKELEQRNLFVISRGIDAGFSADKIKEMVI